VQDDFAHSGDPAHEFLKFSHEGNLGATSAHFVFGGRAMYQLPISGPTRLDILAP
jgi:hypothetical protein